MDSYVDDLFDPVLDHGPPVCTEHDHTSHTAIWNHVEAAADHGHVCVL